MSNSARLLQLAGDAWNSALGMRFIRDATENTLAEAVFARYLVLERGFVDTACRSLGAAILRSPTARALRGHAMTLASFVVDQGDYFERALEGVDPAVLVGQQCRVQAGRLSARVLDVCDSGTYADVVCCMLPSECLYEVWCGRAAALSVRRSASLEEWIASHAAPPYTDTVAFLRSEVDALELDEHTLSRLAGLVADVLDLERSFHDAAYLPD